MRRFCAVLVFLAVLATSNSTLRAQDDDGGPVVRDGGVGYLDNAFPMSQFRLRFDAAWRSNRPTRGEFFYPKGGATGPGLPKPDPSIDYQDVSGYLEWAPSDRFSLFLETPVRFIDPTRNPNSAGLADMNFGGKWAFLRSDDTIVSAMLRTFVPTGDSDRGLGTHHVSVEPGILFSRALSDNLILSGETTIWVPIDGTDFAGEAVHYGLGLTWGQRQCQGWWATPVVEFVGWTFLDGKALAVFPHSTAVLDASGDTILNGKLGVRFGNGERWDIYTGYGRALTGDVFYKDIFRLELRLLF